MTFVEDAQDAQEGYAHESIGAMTPKPGGPMAVEPPLRVESREELVWLLTQACELEHGLMCEYLFAQFTLRRSQQEGLSAEQLAKVAGWEAVIVDVTKQEMLHLALATNLLTAIGAAPHLH